MKKVCVLFPGQGSQYVGMGKKWLKENLVAKRIFEEASDILGMDMVKLCIDGDLEQLSQTKNTQLSILTVSVAAFRVFMSEYELEPEYLVGHSLGEISALTCAGAMSFTDAINIVRMRGKLMSMASNNLDGKMLAIEGLDRGTVDKVCRSIKENNSVVSISNYNAPKQYVISGHTKAVDEAEKFLKNMGATTKLLRVSAPFHCVLMQKAADSFKKYLEDFPFKPLQYKVISNVNARIYSNPDDIGSQLANQIVSPVLWEESMALLKHEKVDLVIDIGPKATLRNLARLNEVSFTSLSFEGDNDMNELTKYKKPNKKTQFLYRSLAIAVSIKNNNWNNEEYMRGVIVPYRNIKSLTERLEKEDLEPTLEDIEQALNMLHSVFVTKKTPLEEQKSRYEQLLRETGTEELFYDRLKSFMNSLAE